MKVVDEVQQLLLKLVGSYLAAKAKPHKIRRAVQKLNIVRSGNLDAIDRQAIRVAAVQEKVILLKSVTAYVEHMNRFVTRAVQQGSQLIVFPELNGVLGLGMIPFIERILARALPPTAVIPVETVSVAAGKQEPDSNNESQALDIVPLVAALTPFITNIFTTTFAELAKAHGVYIMAGSTLLAEEGKLYNRAYLYGPDGVLIGRQDKLHPDGNEVELGLTQGTDLNVFDTEIGRLAFPVCMDATYFETFKIAKQLGAEIVIIPIANMEEYVYHFALRGIWPRVQESGVYGIKSALVGDLFHIRFTGKAGVFAPLLLTEEQDGVVAEATSYNEDDVICTTVDLDALAHYDDPYFTDTNPAVYERYLLSAY